MTTGILAKKIMASENYDKDLIDKAFMSGILHDLGKLVLASKFPHEYMQIINRVESRDKSIPDQERQIFAVTHSELGAYLTGLWGLPSDIIEAISLHHNPGNCMIRQARPLTAVHAANGLLHNTPVADQKDDFLNLDAEYLTALNLINSVPNMI